MLDDSDPGINARGAYFLSCPARWGVCLRCPTHCMLACFAAAQTKFDLGDERRVKAVLCTHRRLVGRATAHAHTHTTQTHTHTLTHAHAPSRWAFASLEHHVPSTSSALCTRASQMGAGVFKEQELSNIVWALGRWGACRGSLRANVCVRVCDCVCV